MRRLLETSVAIGLAAALALAGCSQGGGTSTGSAAGSDAVEAAPTQAEGSAATIAEATGLEALDGWWKVTSNESVRWTFNEETLAIWQPRLELAGLFTVNASNGEFILSTIGGNMNGIIVPDEEGYHLEIEGRDGFTVVDGGTVTLDGDTLTITLAESIDLPEGEVNTEIVIQCERTNDYADYDSVWDVCEELHEQNRSAVGDPQHEYTDDDGNMPAETVLADTDYAELHVIGYSEDEENVTIVFMACSKMSALAINGNDLASDITVNDTTTLTLEACAFLPANPYYDDITQTVDARWFCITIPKAAVGGQVNKIWPLAVSSG